MTVAQAIESRPPHQRKSTEGATWQPGAAATHGAPQIRELDETTEPQWEAYVAAHAQGTFFHKAGWRRVIQNTYGHKCRYLVAEGKSGIAGVLPLVHVRSRLFGNALISTGFCVHGGILADTPEIAAALAARAAELGTALKVDYVELRSETPRIAEWQLKTDVYATFDRALSENEDENLKAIPRKKRADVRKSLKNGLLAETGAPIETFHQIYAHSLRGLGTPVFSRGFVRALVAEFGNDVEISLVSKDGEAVASLLSFYFNDRVLPYYGGALPAARGLHAYDYLYWTLMCRAVERGARVFDFGRSKFGTGAFDYKKYWGFEPRPLNYQYHLVRADEVPDINPNNPKYERVVRIWQRLPLGVSTVIGPWVARQLG